MPRFELVSAHMAANLAMNATGALKGCPVRSVNGWTDSTMALHWIGGSSELWCLGPKWLAEREQWPDDIEIIPTSETETEAKLVRDVLAIAVKFDDNLDQLMVNHTFWKAVRILSWVARFLHNCRHKPKQRLSGPLKTEEIDEQIGVWVKRAQAAYLKTE